MPFFKRRLDTDSFTNLISACSDIQGTVKFDGVLQIEGFVDGAIISHVPDKGDSVINITASGNVKSEKLFADDIVIAGQVTSKIIWAEDTLRILKSAKVTGATLYYRTLEIEPGAHIHECQLKSLDHCSEGEDPGRIFPELFKTL